VKTRGLVVVVAVLLAGVATAAVYMYVRGVQSDVQTDAEMVQVVVAKEDIPAGARLDELIGQGMFTTRGYPRDLVVEGAVVSLEDLQGAQTSSPILAGEQISVARLRGEAEVGGGILGIPPGMKAVSIPLDGPRAVGAAVQQGDRVTVYVTAPLPSGNTTLTLVPDVQLLRVVSGGTGQTGGAVVVTLALTPEDAQKVVFAMESGKVWLGLLPPNEEGTEEPPVTLGDLTR
jgi:pilus assembly protein CpaB